MQSSQGAVLDSGSRRQVFLFQDGVILAATLRGLAALGLLDRSSDTPTIAELCPDLPASGFAHLRVGLRTLAQVGWIASAPGLSPDTARLDWTDRGRIARRSFDDYLQLGDWLAQFGDSSADVWSRRWTLAQHAGFEALAERAGKRWGVDNDSLTRMHLDGALLTPLLLSLGGRDHAWALANSWMPSSEALAQIAPHLGLTGSYLPMLARLPDLYRGLSPALGEAGVAREWHVQRELNIRASTAAHGRYFADADALIRSVLNQPIEEQPGFVLDTGCGDGTWLARVAGLVNDTARGRVLARFPLRIVGADLAWAATERARAALAAQGVDALVVEGDVSDPEGLAATLAGHGLDMADALHLHAFIDHDRGFRGAPPGQVRHPLSTGAFIGPDGSVLSPGQVAADLAAHLARWAPFARRHGLITLEAHCVPPRVAARQQGALHSIAFDACHGYSRQYPIEHGAYLEAVRRAGLRPTATGGRCYPSDRPFVAVSLNHLLGSREPSLSVPDDEALADGRALHRLLYREGDTNHVRTWCAPATSRLITRAMELLEARLASLPPDGSLRVCDYGTGTGLAAIELRKACRERGFGARIELLCLDIPSPWFSTGQALLAPTGAVEFRSLTDADRFRPLPAVMAGLQADLVVASMVFHLIRPPALARVAADIAEILAPGGSLLWNAPDVGPAGPCAMLFHDANRRLRAHWEAMLRGEIAPETPAQRAAVASAAPMDAARAGRRILAVANDMSEIAEALGQSFEGSLAGHSHEIRRDELAEVLRVPSNHREFLPEIATDALRLEVIGELMERHILQTVCEGPAASGLGVAIRWTSGEHRPRR